LAHCRDISLQIQSIPEKKSSEFNEIGVNVDIVMKEDPKSI